MTHKDCEAGVTLAPWPQLHNVKSGISMAEFIKKRGSRFRHLNPQLLGPKSQGLKIKATDDNYSTGLRCGIAIVSNAPYSPLLPHLVTSFTIRAVGKKQRKWHPTQRACLFFILLMFYSGHHFAKVGQRKDGEKGQRRPREELWPLYCVFVSFLMSRADGEVLLQDKHQNVSNT